jgi:hypothetical protein
MRISRILTSVVRPLRQVAASRRNLLTAARRGGECLVPARHASPVRELTGLSTAHLSQLGVSPVGSRRCVHGGAAARIEKIIREIEANSDVEDTSKKVDRPSGDACVKGIIETLLATMGGLDMSVIEGAIPEPLDDRPSGDASVKDIIGHKIKTLLADMGGLDMSVIEGAIAEPLEEFGADEGNFGFIYSDQVRGRFERAYSHLKDNPHLPDRAKSREVSSWMDKAKIDLDWSHSIQVSQLFSFFGNVRDCGWKGAVEAYLSEDFIIMLDAATLNE